MAEINRPDTPSGEACTDGVPAEVLGAITALLHPDETLLAAAASDMDHTGRFAQTCLVATDRRMIGWRIESNTPRPAVEVPVKEISCVKRLDARGVCRLDIHTRDQAHTAAYYTRSRIRSFDLVTREIERLLKDAGTEPDTADVQRGPGRGGGFVRGNAPRTCEACGKPIPRRLGVCPDCIDKKRLLLRLMSRARPYLPPMLAGLALMLVITAVEMAQPVLTKVLIDRVIPNSDLRLFLWIVAGIIAIHSCSAVFSGVRSYLMAWLGEKIVHDLRKEVYEHVQTLSLEFYDQRQTGWIMDRVSADTGNLQNFLAEGFQDFMRDIMTIVVILAIMFSMNWQLTLVTLLPAPAVAILTARFMRKVRRLYHSVWRRRSYMTTLLANVIPGVRVVKAFAQEKREAQRFRSRSHNYMQASIKAARSFATFHPITRFTTSLGFVMVWGFGGYMVITGRGVTLGTLVAFISYLWRFYGPLNNLSRFSRRIQRATTSAQRVFDVLDTTPRVQDPTDPLDIPVIQGRVDFRNVSFGYDPDEPVLRDISFSVRPGEMIGLVGPSGAGKSTTINLLCRFYDVDEGAIEIDGHDIRDIGLGSLHRQVGVVLQDPFLFHGTIAENISYGNPDARLTDIMEAARAANAHEFILRMPDGYDTMVGERGQRISGGERQRISIARAILKDPRILILDEATSSVDTETEGEIQEAIARLVQGRTTFAIAHRFSTLKNADRLVVLEEGRLVEIGSHVELLAKEDGLFKRLCDMQTKNSQIVAVGG